MKLGLKFPERLAGVLYPVREALEDLIIGIEKGWSQEHLGTGQHNAITAVSIGHPTPAEASVLAITSGLEVRQGPASLSGAFASNSADPSVLAPPQITGTVDDYSPAGLDQALVIRLNVDAARTMAGLRRPQPNQARLYWLVNTTTSIITLSHEATSSTASNRFYCPGVTDYYLPAYGAVAILYDPVTLRWRVVDSSVPGLYWDNANSRIGIGTTSPAQQLTVASTAPSFQMTDTTASAKSLRVVTDANVTNFYEAAGTAGGLLTLDLANTRVGMGTATPSQFFTVLANVNGDYVSLLTNSNTTSPFGMNINYSATAPNGTTNAFLVCSDNAANRFVARSNGGLANFQANNVDLSDAAAKTVYGPAEAERERFRRLAFMRATYTDSPDSLPDVMLTAQDVQAIYPSLVIPFDEDRGLLGLRTHGVAMRAYKVIQELDQALLKAEQRIAALEAAGAKAAPPDRIRP